MKTYVLRFITIIVIISSSQLLCSQGKEEAETSLNLLNKLPASFDALLSANSLSKLNQNINYYSQVSKQFNQIAQSEFGHKKICQARLPLIQRELNSLARSGRSWEKSIFDQASVNVTNERGDTMLTYALRYWHAHGMPGDLNIIPLYLIDCGADVNYISPSDKSTPLMLAAAIRGDVISTSNKATLIHTLLVNGAQKTINLQDSYDSTALMYAIDVGDASVVKALLNAGAKATGFKNKLQETALAMAKDAIRVFDYQRNSKDRTLIFNLIQKKAEEECSQGMRCSIQ